MPINLWHADKIDSLLSTLQTSQQGLSQEEASKRVLSTGPNTLPSKKPTPNWVYFVQQMKSPIVGILGLATLFKLALGQIGQASAILFVILFNGVLGFFQEKKADKSMNALQKFSQSTTKVFRDGHLREMPTEEIVPGDLLYVDSGVTISADARLINTHSLEVDESILTGESTVVHKDQHILREEAPVAERKNMLFSGTTVTRGRGYAIVTETGIHTQTAQIVIASQEASPPPSPLKTRLDNFGWNISMIAIGIMLLLTIAGIFQGFSFSDLVMTWVSLTVSAVPEGLPIAVTVVLSQGLLSMAKRHALVRHLSTIETLGCTTTICTDKTGTLTKNKLQVAKISPLSPEAFSWACRISYLCSESRQENSHYVGDPIEIALMKYAREQNWNEDKRWSTTLTIPYEPEIGMMACSITDNTETFTIYKGAPEKIEPLSTHMWQGEKIVPIETKHIEQQSTAMAKEGLRVLALAYKTDGNTVFVALVGLIDPPRKEAVSAIQTAHAAGIKVLMITGDKPETAYTIASKIGLAKEKSICTGYEMEKMSDNNLLKTVRNTTIFARTTPVQKLRIVEQLQRNGEVVAMTGDGVNDTPPLCQADIGIAMGGGSDVAKQASDMIILDDNFVSIVEAIRKGRIIFKNLQQMAAYLLTTCFGGVLTIAMSVLAGFPLPLLPLQILWINLVTDGTTTVPLAMEGEHGNIMKYPPRKKTESFLSRTMSVRALIISLTMMIGTTFLFYWSFFVRNDPISYSRTIAFTTLALFQICNALNCRSLHRSLFFSYRNLNKIPFFDNKILLIVLSSSLILQIAAVQLSLLQTLLDTSALTFFDWTVIITTCSSVIFITEIHKALLFFRKKKELDC